jgi:hypothetical protein
MKKSYLMVILALTCAIGLGTAHAQDEATVVVNVPFEFVAGGATLPAGTYTVGPVSTVGRSALLIRSFESGAFLLPVVFDGALVAHTQLSFEHVGDKNFLSTVETPAGVYTLETPREMTKLAQTKDQGTVASSSGSN